LASSGRFTDAASSSSCSLRDVMRDAASAILASTD
jgi:hypothetical protein